MARRGRALTRALNVIPGEGLRERLERRTSRGVLFEPLPGGSLRCSACAHRCVLPAGSRGSCGVRRHVDGALQVPFGYVARKYVRPVETNTIFHVLPGALALTFGMFGCDLRCPYCHNAKVSQALRDGPSAEEPIDVSAEALVDEALDAGCQVLCAAYNEPMIAAEWVHAVFSRAKRRGLVMALISDGNSTPEALAFLRPVSDVFRVDLKGSSEAHYRELGGRLGPVLASIREARRLGFWVEVVTLVVPGLNDDLAGLRGLADELCAIDAGLPWHLNAFVPRYRLRDRQSTAPELLMSAAGSAYARGLEYVYVGNLPATAELAHTRCPACHATLVRRFDYRTQESRLERGACPDCRRPVPGLFQLT